MSKKERDYNVDCVRGYGQIIFVKGRCPISGVGYCERCDVILEKDLGEDRKIKKQEG